MSGAETDTAIIRRAIQDLDTDDAGGYTYGDVFDALSRLSGRVTELEQALRRLEPYARRAETRWMSVEDATIELPARLVAEMYREVEA